MSETFRSEELKRFEYHPNPLDPEDAHLEPGAYALWAIEVDQGVVGLAQALSKLADDLGQVPVEFVQRTEPEAGRVTIWVPLVVGARLPSRRQ